MERDARQLEALHAGMAAGSDPRAAHYGAQLAAVRSRAEQLSDMYLGYTAATSVRGVPSILVWWNPPVKVDNEGFWVSVECRLTQRT